MNARSLKPLLLALPLVASAAVLPACKSSGPDQAARTTDNVGNLSTELKVASKDVGTTLAALDGLVASADADMRPRYDEYTKALSKLESQRGRVKYQADAMSGSGASYFKSWEESVQSLSNPEFQKRSLARLEEAKKNFDEASKYVDETSERFDAMMSDFRDIREFLGQDLNKTGLETIKDLIKNSKDAGADVQERIDKVTVALDEVRVAMSANTAPPPAEGGAGSDG